MSALYTFLQTIYAPDKVNIARWASLTMTRTLTLIAVGLITCGGASGEQFNTIISQCWEGNDHPKMSACVRVRASQASAALKSIESEVRDAIAKSKEPAYVKNASAAFEANVQSFRKYRNEQCSFVFTLASVGNGAEDNKRACEVELDVARIEQLGAASWWLKECTAPPNPAVERTLREKPLSPLTSTLLFRGERTSRRLSMRANPCLT